MRQILSVLIPAIFLASLHANALLITDTFVVEKQLLDDDGIGHVFELIPAGYSPETDSIKNIRLIYDFTEIYSDTNHGDEEDYPDDVISWPPSPNEFVILSSWIFGWRDPYADIDTGLMVFETDWVRNDWCQFPSSPMDEVMDECLLNIDLYGTMNAGVTPYTDNLWLHSITAEIEVDRVDVPEPSSALLLGLGLFVIGFLRRFKFALNNINK
jgi:hypothetical protein